MINVFLNENWMVLNGHLELYPISFLSSTTHGFQALELIYLFIYLPIYLIVLLNLN